MIIKAKHYTSIIFLQALSAGLILLPTLSLYSQEEATENPSENISIQQNTLDYDTAINRIISNSPKLKIAELEIQAAAADVQQVSMYPNPYFSYELDNIGGSGDWNGADGSESTYQIDQPIELGGKRRLRRNLATYEYYAAVTEYDIIKTALLNMATKTYIDLIEAQEYLRLANEKKDIAEKSLEITLEKLNSGKVSSIKKARAEIALSKAESELTHASMVFLGAKETLSNLWGCQTADFDFAVYPFYMTNSPASLCDYIEEIDQKPELVQVYYESLAAKENVHLQRSNGIPDVTLSVGYITENNSRNQGFLLGVGLPLPVFDRNQGEIRRARADASKAVYIYEDVRRALTAKLTLAHKKLAQSYQNSQRLNQEPLKLAQQTCDLAQEGHQDGKFEYLEVLEMHKELIEIKENQIEILSEYHHKKADIDFLTSDFE
ncbi:MAG: TolC family protein [Parachlamydiaceae bacterium]|nr:TolC family protein [Parachlamydiaceae bacterium]